jgi:CHAT domain-containing protein
LPPSPFGRDHEMVGAHLAKPQDLRRAQVRSRLAFLASCLSSRNEEYPGDDLMGITRAIFAAGTGDMIAGFWTVVSGVTGEFVRTFYEEGLRGRPVAGAMLAARQRVAETHSDPFHWGVFLQQGGNLNLSKGVTADGR